MTSPEAIRYAINYCIKYPEHNINKFLLNELTCETEMVSPFLLVQYKIIDGNRVFYSMFFDHEMCDRKSAIKSAKEVKMWFSMYPRRYVCSLPKIPSIRKYLMSLTDV